MLAKCLLIYCTTCSSTDVPGFVLAPNMFTPYNAQATVHSYEVSSHFDYLKSPLKFEKNVYLQ